LTLLTLLIAGCPPVDNSGGFAPDGDDLPFQSVAEDLGVTCSSLEDSAVVLDSLDEVDVFLAGCADGAETVRSAAATLDSAVGNSFEGEREFAIVSAHGGCIRSSRLELVRLDLEASPPTLRPWLLRGDAGFETESDCAAPTSSRVSVHRAADAAAAEAVELTVGTYNPDLPGAPNF
jgi:hypothetical protein